MMKRLLGLAIALSLFATQAIAASGIIAGAIRWDAWYSNFGSALSAQQALGPTPFQNRAPINCTAVSTVAITCPASQATMDAEINAAVSGGLKFWAFDQFSPSSSLTTAWNLYQSSTINNRINWCWITALANMGSTGNFSTQVATFTSQMQQSNYQKVTVSTSNRPVLFILWSAQDFANNWGSSYTNVATMITALRTAVTGAGLGTPYIVVQGGIPANVATEVTSIGADAVGAYNPTFPAVPNGTYPQLDTAAQSFWTAMAVPGLPTVPVAINGWLTTPRIAQVETLATPGQIPYSGINNVYAISTNSQFVTHLQAAVSYINSNPSIVPSKLLLIYAWTECDEGGCITPTGADPAGSKLQAIFSTIN